MFVARMLYPVEVLGPGKRIGIWLSGCTRACHGCSNPELWIQRNDQKLSVERLSALVHRIYKDHQVDGFTITGGEPMDQAEELSELVLELLSISSDILVYSGYTLEQLSDRHDPATYKVLQTISVLIDGEYVEEQNDGSPMRGSSNQRVHILNEAYRALYERYMLENNRVQNFSLGNSIVSAGIHAADYQDKMKRAVEKKGLVNSD